MNSRTFCHDVSSPERRLLDATIASDGWALGDHAAEPVDEAPGNALEAAERVMEGFRDLTDAGRQEAIEGILWARRNLGLIAATASQETE